MLEQILEKSEIMLKNLFMHWHFMEIIKDQPDVHMKLPITVVRVKEHIHLLDHLTVS